MTDRFTLAELRGWAKAHEFEIWSTFAVSLICFVLGVGVFYAVSS